MALTFSPDAQRQIDALLRKYPTRMAACLPVLWIAQEQFGWISDEVMTLVAHQLDLPLSHVHGVVTFYTMFHTRPVGRYVVEVCTNTACMLRDGYEVLSAFERALGIRCGETTADGLFTLGEAECLAACGGAPCVRINDEYHEPVRPENVEALVAGLRGAATSLGAASSPPGPTSTEASVKSSAGAGGAASGKGAL